VAAAAVAAADDDVVVVVVVDADAEVGSCAEPDRTGAATEVGR
jgi:hypothetical protein